MVSTHENGTEARLSPADRLDDAPRAGGRDPTSQNALRRLSATGRLVRHAQDALAVTIVLGLVALMALALILLVVVNPFVGR
jgi:hypothetical protein